jgi:hypothetical protein
MAISIAATVTSAKHKKTLLALITGTAVAAIISVLLTLSGNASAIAGPTCTVAVSGADYTSIQTAVNDTNCNTVKVAAGTYTENVTITRTVNLKGAKANSDVDGRTFGAASESKVIGLVTIQAANVTVNGFSLTNPNQGLGVIVKTAGNGAVINNNIIDGIGGSGYSPNAQAVYLEYGPDNVKISGNKISHVQSGPSAKGIYIGDSTSADPSLGIRLTDNTISDITSTSGAYGIQINNGSSNAPTATGYTTVKINGNTISSLNGGWTHAIGLEGDTPNVEVTKNVISNLTATSIDKVGVWFETNIFFFTADVSRNNLAVGPSAAGIYVHPDLTNLYTTLQVDGSCNYWGTKDGPSSIASGSGSHVSAGVDYSPWLNSSKLKGDCGQKQHNDDDNHHWKHDNNYDD